MKLNLLSSIIIMSISLSIKAQNTTFNNVSIGTDVPANGVQIKTNFPGVTAGWARGFHITNEDGTQNFIGLGAFGGVVNGISSLKNAYIGKGWDSQYMTFLANGNIGIGTTNPVEKLQIGNFNNNQVSKISIPGTYNFEEIKLGQYGNGASALEFINHTSQTKSYGVRLFANIDSGINGLQIQTADPSETYQNLSYTTRLAVLTNGNIGIGTLKPDEKLTVKGKIHAEEVRIDLKIPTPDYVFANNYKLKSLQEVEEFIKQNSHLPEIPSAKEIEKNGLMLAEMNMSLLKKIEELTLYSIAQEKKINTQAQEIEALKNLALRVAKIENELSQTKN